MKWLTRNLGSVLLMAATIWLGCRFTPDENAPPADTTCRSIDLSLNAADPHELAPCRATACGLEPDGAVGMSYCLVGAGPEDPSPWATCTVATGKNLNGFDADHDGQGVLEVTFCVDRAIRGALDLWYGSEALKRKYLELLNRDDTMEGGCRTVFFTPEMARYPEFNLDAMGAEERSSALPQACSGKCGRTPGECQVDFSETQLTLAGEFLVENAEADARVRLASVRLLSPGCLCDNAWDCEEERDLCRAGSFAPLQCEGSSNEHEGACVSGGASDCAGTIGLYAEGWIDGQSDAFLAGYMRHELLLGCPFDNGGGLYVHRVRDAVDVQDLLQPDEAMRLSSDGQSALVGNGSDVYVIHGALWGVYKCMRMDDGGAVGGATLLGTPLGESQMENDVVRQDFELGWMKLYADSAVVVYFNDPDPVGFDLSETQGCAASAGIQLSISQSP